MLSMLIDYLTVYGLTVHDKAVDHTVLHNYIEAAQITVYTSLSGYDDLPGLGGIQVHDSYQLCLYFSKEYVAISSIHNDIIPIALDDNADRDYVWNSNPHGSGNSSFVNYLLNEFERHRNYMQLRYPDLIWISRPAVEQALSVPCLGTWRYRVG
jgi:hypothetical protein